MNKTGRKKFSLKSCCTSKQTQLKAKFYKCTGNLKERNACPLVRSVDSKLELGRCTAICIYFFPGKFYSLEKEGSL